MIVLKIIGGILLGIIGLIFIISLFSIKIIPSYTNQVFSVKLKIAFFSTTLYPSPPEDKKDKTEPEKKKAEKPTEPDLKAIKEEPTTDTPPAEEPVKSGKEPAGPPSEPKPKKKAKKAKKKKDKEPPKTTPQQMLKQLERVLQLIKDLKSPLTTLRKHTIIDKVFIDITVGGEDAHKTAVSYGNHITLITSLIGGLSSYMKIKLKQINLQPDFLSEESSYNANLIIRIRIFWLLKAGIVALVKLIKYKDLIIPDSNKKGNYHEPTKTT